MTTSTVHPPPIRTVPVHLGDRSYEIRVTGEPFDGLEEILGRWRGGRAALVTDRNVDELYGDIAVRTAEAAGIGVVRLVQPPGEGTKSFAHLKQLLEALIEAEIGRDDLVVALGGGVIGDLAALAASMLRRGVPVVHLPTSLVAQVDSAVGGKTGINTRHGKNLVGTFHQPAAVIAATGCLATLPDEEMRSGLAEVVKYALLDGEEFVSALERDVSRIEARESAVLVEIVATCLRHKAKLVEGDERDGGARRLLNLGHTLGHALELAAGYGGLRHGEAVAIGLVGALELSTQWCGLAPATVQRVRSLLVQLGLPVRSPPVSRETLEGALLQDKKQGRGGLTWVLLPELGAPVLHSVPLAEASGALDRLAAEGVIRWETP